MNETEKETIIKMIRIYCNAHHNTAKKSLCPACSELSEYAQKKRSICTFGENKPTCQKCPIHCYTPQMKEQIRTVMRYSGPKMIFKHPLLAVIHLMKTIRS
jgi:hypothetical protein